jgi:hypothetical protein
VPSRILREGIELPLISELKTEADVLAVRAVLPKLNAGDPLQAYKWALSIRLRAIRNALAGSASPKEIRRLFSEAGETCVECKNWMGDGAKRHPSLDHKKALANGGTNEIANLRVICNRCNSSKGDRA